MIKQLLLSGLSVMMTVFSYGQSMQNENESNVLLKNHTVRFSKLSKESIEALPSFDGYTYLIVQGINHKNRPEGITYKGYLPKNAGLYQIENNELKSVLQFIDENNGHYASMRPEWKLSKRLFTNNIPDWAWLEDRDIKVWLSLYPGVSLVKAQAALKVAGERILELDAQHNLIAVQVSAARATTLANYPFVLQVQEMEDPGSPENWTARTSHRVNYLQSEIPGSSKYDGTGVTLSCGDDGVIGPHIDYTGRLTQTAAGNSTGDHGDHVAGTIFGAGNMDPRGRGMAPGLDMVYYSYPANLSNADSDYNNNGVVLTSSSYSNGCNAGYTNFTLQMDQDYAQNPNLIHVFSAGNSGTSDCGYGANAGWGNVTGGHKIAKNVIAVANLTRLDGLASSSSRGPASDGRIKPDVGAVGTSVFSTTDVNDYTLKTGTSMSCPGTSGTLAVLYQAYKETHGGTTPNGALMKAILMNSAEDLGNAGPDFRHGFGRINARRALKVIDNDQFISSNIANNGSNQHTVTIPNNVSKAKIMLYWGDVPGLTVAARALVNDLDMTVSSGGNTLQPLVLDPTPNATNLNAVAVPARDSLNNVEQIVIDNPSAGDVTVNVSGFNIPNGTQSYYIVYVFEEDEVVLTHPVGGEKFAPATDEIIRWDAPEGGSNFDIDYSIDNGQTWQTVASNLNNSERSYIWRVPNTITSEAKVRVTSGSSSSSPGIFTILGTPKNLNFVGACPDTLLLTWNPVPQAAGYVIYRLGQKYMDSVLYTVSNLAKLPNIPLTGEEYFAVAAVANGGGIGERSIALERPEGVFNCQVKRDLSVVQLQSPPEGNIPDCYSFSNVPIRAEIRNLGADSVFAFSVSYSFNGGTTVTDNFTDTLAPGDVFDYSSAGTISINAGTAYNTKLWVTFTGDGNRINDTTEANTQLYTGQTQTFPFSDNLETNIPSCNTTSNCVATSCVLNGGWYNYPGASVDGSDWRGNSGGTPSGNTGPSVDQNPGTGSGTYLYIEASDCFNQTAWVQTPCIDLATANNPILSFYYHMSGLDMGTLEVDIYNGEAWELGAFTVSGNQGNSWNEGKLNLTKFAGDKVMLRFRGITGPSFTSDIAIDNVSIQENASAPISDFTSSTQVTCVNGTVSFSENSANFPNKYKWEVNPSATANFVNGNDTAANVSIKFTVAGSYDVSLISTNAVGSDTITKTAFITASTGTTLSIFEDFENNIPLNWAVVNPDGFTAWQVQNVIGSNGSSTKAATFNNYNNPLVNSRDDLVTINLDLVNDSTPLLYFDVAYAPNLNGADDSLLVMVSNDCGTTFSRTGYAKGASQLATTTARNSRFIPGLASDWRVDSVDLSSFIGQNIKVAFVAKSRLGNAVFIDNVQLVDGSVVAPTVSLTSSTNSYCFRDTVTFSTGTATGVNVNYNWDFGSLANPRTATGPGPHDVVYLSAAAQTATVVASNAGGQVSDALNFTVFRSPVSVFTFAPNNLQVNFTDVSINNPTSWSWDFGDGNTSTLQNPSHTYAAAGTYQVILIVSNDCGTTSRNTDVTVTKSNVSLDENQNITAFSVFPNPSKDNFVISTSVVVGGSASIQVSDLSGKLIEKQSVNLNAGENELNLNMSSSAPGVYILSLETESGTRSLRIIKQ